MYIAIVDRDELSGQLLAHIARRRGHTPLVVTALSELPQLPFNPTVTVMSMDRMDETVVDRVAPLRERFPESLIMLTAESMSDDGGLLALESGVADVLTTPYHPRELLVRAERHVSNRGLPEAETNSVTVGDLEVDLDRYAAHKAAEELTLTKLELRLLFCLMQNYESLSTTDRLLSFGWEGREMPDAGLLKTHISHLRRKLREAGGDSLVIAARHSLGYTLQPAT